MSKKNVAPITLPNTKESMYEMLTKFFNAHPEMVSYCFKEVVDNIIYPKFPSTGIYSHLVVPYVKTKEDQDGCNYDPKKHRMLVRLINGLFKNKKGEYDSYCWEDSVFEKETNIKVINRNSVEGMLNLNEFLSTMKDVEEKEYLLTDIINLDYGDFYWVRNNVDLRLSIEVTQELFDAGLTKIINEWANANADGSFDTTNLVVGDRLIWTLKVENGKICSTFYRCEKEMYLETYTNSDKPFLGVNEHLNN